MTKTELCARKEFDLGGIVPWGRRFSEYEAFFGLEGLNRCAPVLDAGGGPSSFAAEARARGIEVVSVDPLYQLPTREIERRFEQTAATMRVEMHRAAYRFNWAFYGSENAVHRLRREALKLFLDDFPAGLAERRYVAASLPVLPFADCSFRLALVSHLLFLYGDQLDFAFHLAALRELLRVALEVRVFPLINLDGLPSSHLPGVMNVLRGEGVEVALVDVPFEFQKGATRMLVLRRGGAGRLSKLEA